MSNFSATREAVVQLVVDLLKADDSIVAIVADRVHGQHQYDADEGAAQPCLIVAFDRTQRRMGGELLVADLHLYAYSKVGLGEARQLYDLAFDVLHSSRLSSADVTTAGWIRELGDVVEEWNPRIRAHFVRGTWRAMTGG